MNFIIQFIGNCKLSRLLNLPLFEVLYSKLFGIIFAVREFFFAFKNLYGAKVMKSNQIAAFSYAEAIIACGVLGIVATQTIPVLYTDYERNLALAKLQNEYAVLSSGMNSAIKENGSPDTWGLVGANDATGLFNINLVLSQYFKMSQNCNTASGCFADDVYKNMKGADSPGMLDQDNAYTKFRLADGTSVAVTQLNDDCGLDWGEQQLNNVCGMVLVDINGNKIPNTYGEDLFGFALTKDGIVPLGAPIQTNGYPFSAFCSQNSNANFKYENGLSCTAWALYNRNMDYLDCKGLNWNNGKTTCKG